MIFLKKWFPLGSFIHKEWNKHLGFGCLFPFLKEICEDKRLPQSVHICEKTRKIQREVIFDLYLINEMSGFV